MKDDPTPVLVTDSMVSQAEWWIEQIWMRAEHPAPIPDPLNPKRSHKLVIFPDFLGALHIYLLLKLEGENSLTGAGQ